MHKFRGVHVLLRIFRGGQGFSAFDRIFEGPPPPPDVFDTFPNESINGAGDNKFDLNDKKSAEHKNNSDENDDKNIRKSKHC